jgi:chromosome segregation ATPase
MPDQIQRPSEAPEVSNEQPSALQGVEKEFADHLGKLLEGKIEPESAEIAYFVKSLTEYRNQHQSLVSNIQQGEQQLAQLKTQAMKLEGAIEQGVAAAKHFWQQSKG